MTKLQSAFEQALHRRRCVLREAPRALLSMREAFDGINGIPHSEEAAQRLSRRTHSADPREWRPASCKTRPNEIDSVTDTSLITPSEPSSPISLRTLILIRWVAIAGQASTISTFS